MSRDTRKSGSKYITDSPPAKRGTSKKFTRTSSEITEGKKYKSPKEDLSNSPVPSDEKKRSVGSVKSRKNTADQIRRKVSGSEAKDGERVPFPLRKKHAERDITSARETFRPSSKPRRYADEDFEEMEETTDYSNLRLNKFLAHCGIASRRKADEIISAGRVTVNGVVVEAMGHRVSISDNIRLDGHIITPEKKVYILLNKPKDYITTTRDERERRTVMDLIKPALRQMGGTKSPRLYPIGRLDRNTTGVLLITNDGELAQNLTHPSKKIRKVYHVFLDKKLSPSDFEKIAIGGVVLEDGIAEVDAIAFPNPKSRAEVGLEIHTGKNRFVRRLFESLGYEVVKLDRVAFSEFTKKDIPRGKFRFLTETEVRNLKHFLV